eukprot:gnl/MRDRNA2_/MRDRNA2_58125_c0_seq3.p1 gnl/MRDRNA2_/MRDRNA2_58125_c0~~gnl/MRDRNA2_/MRDRNA2_58125_c0_seq3.p1  ORF type:complete len:127 (+),score=28.81 gnl/MRDRNA2_/MRDRNA2_58125_c0_seq3:90-470(+)
MFQLLDKDSNGSLSKTEMKEYVTPLVKAMSPPEAAALRPLLIAHAADTIFTQVDLNKNNKCEAQEFSTWRANNNLIDQLALIIEGKVYKIWLDNSKTSESGDSHPESPEVAGDPFMQEESKNSIFG